MVAALNSVVIGACAGLVDRAAIFVPAAQQAEMA
jgi:hypothetical protein